MTVSIKLYYIIAHFSVKIVTLDVSCIVLGYHVIMRYCLLKSKDSISCKCYLFLNYFNELKFGIYEWIIG